MSNTSLIVITAFIAIFIQIWFTNFLHKAHVIMLRTRYEKAYLVSPPMSLEHLLERSMLLDEYREMLKKFMKRIYAVSLIVNGLITITVIILIVER